MNAEQSQAEISWANYIVSDLSRQIMGFIGLGGLAMLGPFFAADFAPSG